MMLKISLFPLHDLGRAIKKTAPEDCFLSIVVYTNFEIVGRKVKNEQLNRFCFNYFGQNVSIGK